jgi:hypothetical protein
MPFSRLADGYLAGDALRGYQNAAGISSSTRLERGNWPAGQ